MLEHIADFTAWPILTGILVGYVANRIMSGEGKGCCMNLIMGIIGSYVGTFISHLLNIELLGKGYLTNFVFCVVGAVLIIQQPGDNRRFLVHSSTYGCSHHTHSSHPLIPRPSASGKWYCH